MEVLVLHILKLNIIAAVIILLSKLLAVVVWVMLLVCVPLKGRVSARWKYFIWLFVTVSLLIPVRVPGSISLVDLQLKKSSPDRIAVQEKDISAMTLDEILEIQGITVAEIGMINDLQKAIKANKVITFLGGGAV